jgi:hypothetical protein
MSQLRIKRKSFLAPFIFTESKYPNIAGAYGLTSAGILVIMWSRQ